MKRSAGSMVTLLVLLFAISSRAGVPEGDLLAGVAPGADGMIDVVSITSHPDDEVAAMGGALARLKKDPRVRLHIVCLTNGDMSEARFVMGISREELARVRSGELRASAEALGADEVIQLPYHDQGLKSADQDELVDRIVEIMERTGAEVIITHDPSGITHHPDHVTCSRVVTRAFKQGPASRLYYATLPRGKYLVGRMASPFVEPGKYARPAVKVDISAEQEQKKKALSAHQSQMTKSVVGLLAALYEKDKYEYFTLADKKE